MQIYFVHSSIADANKIRSLKRKEHIMKKIAVIGAGSFNFTRAIVRDIFSFPALSDSAIELVDIPEGEEKMEAARLVIQKMIDEGGYKGTVHSGFDRRAALEGADGVLITIRSDKPEVWAKDLTIPEKYGVTYSVGDTRGPAGIFRFLRSAPILREICRDIEELCPNALVLNYANPMAMLCRYLQGETSLNVTGLCHSVQGTSEMLAQWLGADMKDITYLCAGINHQAFYLDYKWKGEDAYPLIRKLLENEEYYNKELVRNEMFLNLGYYPTESSGHNSEYNAWFRKRPDLIEKYCTHGTGWNPGHTNFSIGEIAKRDAARGEEMRKMLDSPIDLKRGHEYAAYIFNAVFGDGELFEFNGNIRNFGLIDNLPYGACVEVPVLASKYGLKAMHVGDMPRQLAAIINTNAQVEELAVEGCIEGDKTKIFHAVLNDPLTAAVCSMREAKALTDELFEANREYLPQFKF